MDITGLHSVNGQAIGKSVPWKLNQVLQATVLSNNAQGKLNFQIAGQAYSAQTNSALEPGTSFMMKVVSLAPPGLQLIEVEQNTSKSGTNPATTLSPQLLQLAQQVHRNNIGSLLSFIKSFNLLNIQALPAETLSLLTNLKKKIINAKDLPKASKLKPALSQSGLLLESKLASQRIATQGTHKESLTQASAENFDSDLKAILLKLFRSLDENKSLFKQKNSSGLAPKIDPLLLYKGNSPKTDRLKAQLKYKIEDVLGRITMNQKSSLEEFDKGNQVWFFELPVNFPSGSQSIPITIRRDEKQENDSSEESHWQAEFFLELENSGLITVSINISNMSISVSLQSALSQTAKNLGKHSALLQESFNSCGLTLNAFNSSAFNSDHLQSG